MATFDRFIGSIPISVREKKTFLLRLSENNDCIRLKDNCLSTIQEEKRSSTDSLLLQTVSVNYSLHFVRSINAQDENRILYLRGLASLWIERPEALLQISIYLLGSCRWYAQPKLLTPNLDSLSKHKRIDFNEIVENLPFLKAFLSLLKIKSNWKAFDRLYKCEWNTYTSCHHQHVKHLNNISAEILQKHFLLNFD